MVVCAFIAYPEEYARVDARSGCALLPIGSCNTFTSRLHLKNLNGAAESCFQGKKSQPLIYIDYAALKPKYKVHIDVDGRMCAKMSGVRLGDGCGVAQLKRL